jgi:hypothetical protein
MNDTTQSHSCLSFIWAQLWIDRDRAREGLEAVIIRSMKRPLGAVVTGSQNGSQSSSASSVAVCGPGSIAHPAMHPASAHLTGTDGTLLFITRSFALVMARATAVSQCAQRAIPGIYQILVLTSSRQSSGVGSTRAAFITLPGRTGRYRRALRPDLCADVAAGYARLRCPLSQRSRLYIFAGQSPSRRSLVSRARFNRVETVCSSTTARWSAPSSAIALRLRRHSGLDELTPSRRTFRVQLRCIRLASHHADKVHFREHPERLATDHELER